MYSDEFRSPQQLRALRVAQLVSDPEGVYARMERLSSAQRQNQWKRVESERQDLKRRVSDAHRVIKELKKENAKIKSECELAKERLEKLRKSKSMRLGRAMSSPVRVSRRMVKDPKKEALRTARQFNDSWKKIQSTIRSTAAVKKAEFMAKQRANDSTHDRSTQSINVVASKNTARDSSVRLSPEVAFADGPTAASLERLLNHTWFVEGNVTTAAALVREHRSLIEEMSEKGKYLADRVLGADRFHLAELIPCRSADPAYVAEPQRVMYCVHQTPVFNSNGYSTRTRGVAKGLKANGKGIVVVGRSGYPWDSKADVSKPPVRRFVKELDGIDYVHLPGGNLNREPFDRYLMQAADAFVREARMQRPALIQAASNHRTAAPALIAARRVGVPFVYEVRGLWEYTEAAAKPGFENTERFARMRQVETIVANEADLVLAITKQVKDELVARGVNAAKIVVTPNAVDPDEFLPLPRDLNFAKVHKISTEMPVVGFAGSMVGYEGLDTLLEASASLHEQGIEHQVVLAGSGSVEKELKAQAKQLGIADQVRFLGRLLQVDMPRLQSTFDIVCCPRKSTAVTELVSPLKPLESFATHKATVLSNVAPNADLAGRDESRALLCTAGDAESLATSLRRVIEDQELRDNLGRAARLWTVTERSWTAIGAMMTEAHYRARVGYAEEIHHRRKLSELHVGVIGDEFTRTTLEGSFDTELIGRETWSSQLESTHFDLLVIESAWEGNHGEWKRGIGHYSEEESADLRGLLSLAREKGIPSVFWNKEDPVHFARFAPNAALCDHVFTTDANMVPKYHKVEGQINRTISALPFYAQPEIHNPLPTDREFKPSIAYAGTYYGERYADRSKGLDRLLGAAAKYQLDIYDRQANNPESPYKFPVEYQSSVRGSLPYQDVIKSYRTHLAHLNVNSVLNSPTMFSRRVVEIPACGGIVMSAYGRGISETLGSNIANSNRTEDYAAWLHDWTTNQCGRLSEIWRQMRTVYRAHTTESALAIMARTAGVPVEGLKPLRYIAAVPSGSVEAVASALAQSVRPIAVVSDRIDTNAKALADAADVPYLSSLGDQGLDADFQVTFDVAQPRTFAEDVLLARRFTNADTFYLRPAEQFSNDVSVVELFGDHSPNDFTAVASRLTPVGGGAVVVTLPPADPQALEEGSLLGGVKDDSFDHQVGDVRGKTILVAGHDLKFAQGLIQTMENAGAEVILDKWDSHTKHDEAHSYAQLERADIVFCEWGLGNAVWYSNHIGSHQRLVVRVHSQELFRPFLAQIAHDCVDRFIFVSELIRAAAVTSHSVPGEKSLVVPNPVDTQTLDQSKAPGSEKAIGFVGIVPHSKRLDLALDVLESVLAHDPEFVLRIKGKTPEDYPWMKNRHDEMDFYDAQYERIDRLNSAYPGCVVFDGFGADMAQWYTKVGVVLSTSDFESFHLTIADGAASGALPVCLNWPGADRIYPVEWLVPTVEAAAARVLHQGRDEALYKRGAAQFAQDKVFDRLLTVIAGENTSQ